METGEQREREREREWLDAVIRGTIRGEHRGIFSKYVLLKSYRRKPYKIKLSFYNTNNGQKKCFFFKLAGRNCMLYIHPWPETGTMVSMEHNQIVLTYIAHTGCLASLKTFTTKPFYTEHSTHQRTGIDQIKSS